MTGHTRAWRPVGLLVMTLVISVIAAPGTAASNRRTSGERLVAPASAAGGDPRLRVIASGDRSSTLDHMTPDGAHLYVTTDEPLNPGDPNQPTLYDIHAGQATIITTGGAFSGSTPRAVGSTPDGGTVAFTTDLALSPLDQDQAPDLYVRTGPTVEMVAGGPVDPLAGFVAISSDGATVIFRSTAQLRPGDQEPATQRRDLYRWSASTNGITLITPDTASEVTFRAASSDASRVLFSTPDDLTGVLANTGSYGIYERVGAAYVLRGNGTFKGASPDLERVDFATENAWVADDSDLAWDGYRWNGVDDTYQLLTPGTPSASDIGQTSEDGTRWLIYTPDPLVAADTDGVEDVYLAGDVVGPTLLSGAGVSGWNVRGDAELETFAVSTADALVPADDDGATDLYVVSAGDLDHPTRVTGDSAGNSLFTHGFSTTGDRVVFSTSEALSPEDDDEKVDLYSWEPGRMVLLTPATADETPTQPTGMVMTSLEMSRVAFRTPEALDPNDTNVYWDWYLVDFDVEAPQPTITGPSGWTNSSTASFSLDSEAHDAVRFECAIDDGSPEECGPEYAVTALPGGPHSLAVTAWDAVGNSSDPAVRSWSIDLEAPSATAPKVAIKSKAQMGTTRVVLAVTVPGYVESGGSGFAGYRLEQRVDGGGWTSLSDLSSASTRNVGLSPGHTYEIAARAVDKAGNVSARVAGTSFTLRLASEASSSVSYAGTWRTGTSTSYMGGRARYAKSLGAKASYGFTGRSVAWISALGPSRGKAQVYVDGVYRTTVSLYASSTAARAVVYTTTWSSSGSHRITIRALGTPTSHPRVDVDSFVVIR